FIPPSASDIVIESVVVIDITGYTAGVYSFDCEAIGGGEQHQFTVELTMIESTDPEIPEIPVIIPAVPKYIVEYKNISGDDFKLEIWKYDILILEPIYIRGNVNHAYTDRKDLTMSMVSSFLDITLEADQDITLTD